MKTIKLCAFSDEASVSLSGQISALKRNNVTYMEMRSVNGKNAIESTDAELKEYLRQLDGEGISVWSLGSPIGKVDINVNFNEYLDTVKRTAEIANLMRTDKIRMFSFFNATTKRETVMEYLNKMVEAVKPYNVTLYHENEKDIYGDNLARVKDIMANVSGLKFVYDPANFLQVGEKAKDTLTELFDKIDYFHIKDVRVKSGAIVPAGHGDGMIDELIKKINTDMVLSIEPHLAVFDGYSSIDKTALKHEYVYESSDSAFDTAVNAVKKLLLTNGYSEQNYSFIK